MREAPAWAQRFDLVDVAEQITKLKNKSGQDIVQYGFGAVSSLLLKHGLLDELRLWIHPLLVGNTTPDDLISREAPSAAFRLAGSTTLSDGIVILTYQTATGGAA